MVVDPVKRISLLKVPIDVLGVEAFDDAIKTLFSDNKNHQIILISLWDLMRARRNQEFRTMVNGASLVVPISQSIVRGARFLKRDSPVRYMPFDFVIRILGVLERYQKTVYLLGGTNKTLKRAETNIRSTFPGIRVVGRYNGYYSKQVEPDIVQAIRKSTPTLLLVGKGVPGRERWIPRNMKYFNAGIYLWCSDLLDVFAERKKRPARDLFEQGLEWIPHFLKHPWKFYRLFTWLRYQILLLWYRVLKK